MSELDKYFGSKEDVEMLPAKRNTNNWRCVTQLWGILDAFKEEYPNLILTARDRSTNYAAAKEILQIVGETDGPKFVHRAARHRSSNNLAVGSLYSLIQYRLIWFGGNDPDSEASRQRYAGAWEDDDETE